jgi:uncharacterized radical SAM protein YgiQ
MKGMDHDVCMRCSRPSCIWPSVCNNLDTDHEELTSLYKKVGRIPGIKKAFIGSGVRYDLLFRDWNGKAGTAEKEYLGELIKNHVSGRLKVAPEHTDRGVIALMRKAPWELFKKLKSEFERITAREGLKFEVVPYFISSHPGSSDKEMSDLAREVKNLGIKPEQVQDFTPTPMTLSTTMFYCGFDPYTGKKVHSAKSIEEKRRQKDYFFWYKRKSSEKKYPGNKK